MARRIFILFLLVLVPCFVLSDPPKKQITQKYESNTLTKQKTIQLVKNSKSSHKLNEEGLAVPIFDESSEESYCTVEKAIRGQGFIMLKILKEACKSTGDYSIESKSLDEIMNGMITSGTYKINWKSSIIDNANYKVTCSVTHQINQMLAVIGFIPCEKAQKPVATSYIYKVNIKNKKVIPLNKDARFISDLIKLQKEEAGK